MKSLWKAAGGMGTALLVGACATLPTGPSVMVLPGSSKSFEEFQADDAVCRVWAGRQAGPTAEQASTQSGVESAAVGTAVGAAAGAAIGAASGNPGAGAAVGAGSGLLVGSAAGTGEAAYAGRSAQGRYDVAYMQCMYAKGNQIPVPGGAVHRYSGRAAPPPPPAPRPSHVPPPPPGPPPPPPPDAG
jgi:Glycine-zipper domain